MPYHKIKGNKHIQKRILELRNQHKTTGYRFGLGYRTIANIISKEFDITISHQAVKDFIWKKYGKKTDKERKTDNLWENLNKEVLIRDNYTCQMCGLDLRDKMPIIHGGRHFIKKLIKKRYTPVVHHIEPSYEDDLDNLILLCNKCHIKLHGELNCHNWEHYFKKKQKKKR